MRTIIQIQREDNVGFAEAKRRYCAQWELAPADGSVHVGDKYHRKDIRATITITRVTKNSVAWEMVENLDKVGTARRVTQHSESMEAFLRLERKSLEWGAVFEPAPLNTESQPVAT